MWVASLGSYLDFYFGSLFREICGSIFLGVYGHTLLRLLGFLTSKMEWSGYSVLCDDFILQML